MSVFEDGIRVGETIAFAAMIRMLSDMGLNGYDWDSYVRHRNEVADEFGVTTGRLGFETTDAAG